MAGTERRKSRRLGVALPVMIRSGPVSEQCETADVALRGVFVVADRPRPKKSLVSLTIKLPSGSGLNVHGMVARVVSAEEASSLGVPAGMGIRFYGLGKKAQLKWEAFIASALGGGHSEPAGLDAPGTEPDGRAPPPYVADDETTPDSGPRVELRPTPPLRLAGTEESEREVEESPSGVRRSLVIIDPNEQASAARARLEARRHEPGAETPERFERASDDTEHSLTVIDDDEPATTADARVPSLDERDGEARDSGFRVPRPSEVMSGRTHSELDAPATTADASACDFALADGQVGAGEVAEGSITSEDPLPEGSEEIDDEPPTIARKPARPSGDEFPEPKTEVSDLSPPRREPIPAVPRDAPPLARERAGEVARPGASVSYGIGLAPSGPEGFAVYRLAIPTVDALEGFAATALRSGGVFVRTLDVRPSGTPAVVCVVHPLSGDEFHLPGEVVPTSGDRPGVAVGFARVTERTMQDFRHFVALGIPDEDIDGPPTDQDWNELTITDRAQDRTSDIPTEPPENTHEVDIADLEPFTRG